MKFVIWLFSLYLQFYINASALTTITRDQFNPLWNKKERIPIDGRPLTFNRILKLKKKKKTIYKFQYDGFRKKSFPHEYSSTTGEFLRWGKITKIFYWHKINKLVFEESKWACGTQLGGRICHRAAVKAKVNHLLLWIKLTSTLIENLFWNIDFSKYRTKLSVFIGPYL